MACLYICYNCFLFADEQINGDNEEPIDEEDDFVSISKINNKFEFL